MELFIMSLISISCMQNDVDLRLALSVAFIESGFTDVYRPADGHSASYGPLQVKRISAKQIGMSNANLMQPEQSVEVGIRYLKWNLKRCGSVDSALVGYNTGHCGKHNKYSDKVLSKYWRF